MEREIGRERKKNYTSIISGLNNIAWWCWIQKTKTRLLNLRQGFYG